MDGKTNATHMGGNDCSSVDASTNADSATNNRAIAAERSVIHICKPQPKCRRTSRRRVTGGRCANSGIELILQNTTVTPRRSHSFEHLAHLLARGVRHTRAGEHLRQFIHPGVALQR